MIFISLVACIMKRSVALVLLLVSVVRGDVDGLCVTLHCGIQSGACFLDGDCAKVLFFYFSNEWSNLHAIFILLPLFFFLLWDMNETWNRFSRHNSVETEFLTFIQFPFMFRKLIQVHSLNGHFANYLHEYILHNTYEVQVHKTSAFCFLL